MKGNKKVCYDVLSTTKGRLGKKIAKWGREPDDKGHVKG